MMLTITNVDREGPPESLSFEVLTINYSRTNLVTQHPVENVADVTDHIQRQLDEIRVTAIVTETPFGNIGDVPPTKSPILTAEDFLERAAEGVCTLQIAGRPTVPSMALTAWPWQLDKVRRAVFALSFREVRIAQALNVLVPAIATPDTPGASSEQDAGEQAGTVDDSIFFTTFLE